MTRLICLSVRMLREELQLLQEQGSYVGEVVKPMDKKKVLVKVFIAAGSEIYCSKNLLSFQADRFWHTV